MESVALVIFYNNQTEVLLQLNQKNSTTLFADQWSLPEGSMYQGQFSGSLVRGIIEDNYLNPNTFSFFKTYSYTDERTKKQYMLYVFTKKIQIPLLKIALHESQQIDYKSAQEILDLKTTPIIKTIITDFLDSLHFNQ